MNNFGKEVRKAMIDAEMTRGMFYDRTKLSQSYVSAMLAGTRKVCPSFYRHLVDQGLATIPVQIEYAMDRRAVDVAGLSREQVTELVRMADGIRKAVKQ